MAEDDRRSSKRSRFDQTEPELKRSSRFDRRSRSPSNRQPEAKRSRSPISREKVLSPESEERKAPGLDPAAAAGNSPLPSFLALSHMLTVQIAAAAAKINASIQAKKGIQHVDVPPIRAV